MDADALSGRELDAEVARQVFGFEVQQQANRRTGQPDFVYRMSSQDSWLRVAEYSQSMAASIVLENELAHRGWLRVSQRIGPSLVQVFRAL